ncbi:YtcA family lipoprotein [Acinetobacter faecalis]|uniref:YtcA family lipoprotein n=1 Tax=Acinetobacter faecalis TaxID=2665161 RepID=UPI002A90AB7E|nr:YtcA family lipoprotein [Acinetobacter faecalis]MDY6457335.1 YtcA family lipoprotein [Acinetobacter faecalis]MDY6469308.1 YtcA family lipoprotein [Acinetobacter faecalis]
MRKSEAVKIFAYIPIFLLFTGCTKSPSKVVFGAIFPDWIFCILFGLIGTAIVHSFIRNKQIIESFKPLPLSYLSLTVIVSSLLWFLFF